MYVSQKGKPINFPVKGANMNLKVERKKTDIINPQFM